MTNMHSNGPEINPVAVIGPEGFQPLPLSFDMDEPRIRDVDLGERLGMSRPTNIRRVIERNKGEIERYGLVHAASAPIISGKGRTEIVEEYWLNEEQGLAVCQLSRAPKSADARFALIKTFVAVRRGEVATFQSPRVPQSLPEALRLAADLEEQKVALEAKVATDAPKLAAYERAIDADGLRCMTDAGKLLAMKPRTFIKWLHVNGYIYKRTGSSNWVAYQEKLQSGLLEHKTSTYQTDDGTEKSRDQVMVTTKGLMHFAKRLGVELPAEGEA